MAISAENTRAAWQLVSLARGQPVQGVASRRLWGYGVRVRASAHGTSVPAGDISVCGISKMRLVIKLPRAGVLHQAGPGVGAWCSLNVEVVRRATRGALASNTYDSVAGGRGLTGTLRARSGLAQGARFSPLASTISGPVA